MTSQVGNLETTKKDTILKDVDRMSVAHQAVEEYDQKVTGIQNSSKKPKLFQTGKSPEKNTREKLLMDGAFTKLKGAQDALSKSIKVKFKE